MVVVGIFVVIFVVGVLGGIGVVVIVVGGSVVGSGIVVVTFMGRFVLVVVFFCWFVVGLEFVLTKIAVTEVS